MRQGGTELVVHGIIFIFRAEVYLQQNLASILSFLVKLGVASAVIVRIHSRSQGHSRCRANSLPKPANALQAASVKYWHNTEK